MLALTFQAYDQSVASARRPVIADVAAAAGVSHMTVSRVLNGHPSVRPATRERVRAAIETLGYRPNPAARTLAGRRSGIIGVVALESTLFGPSSTLYAVERAARVAGFSVSVTVPDDHVPDAVDRLLRQGAEGIVVIAPLIGQTDALPADNPVVVVEGGVGADHPVVAVDQTAAASAVTNHLLERGARTVAHVAGPDDWHEARARVEGWRLALAAAGATEAAVLRGDWSAASGYACGLELVRRREVEAVFVANDQMALGLLGAFHENRVRVPDDILVAGFDDIPEAAYFTPPLTTIRQNFTAVGQRAIELLIEALDDRRATPTFELVPAELVVRASSTPAKVRRRRRNTPTGQARQKGRPGENARSKKRSPMR